MATDGQLKAMTIIKLNKVICNKTASKAAGKDPKKIMILIELEVLVPERQINARLQ